MPAPRLNRAKAAALERLLDMLYKPAELADELGVSHDVVYRSYIPAGAPVSLDQGGKVWINGRQFSQWARDYLTTTRRGLPKPPMPPGHAYCLRCNQVVQAQFPQLRPHSRRNNVAQLTGVCPLCGGKIFRFVKYDPSSELS